MMLFFIGEAARVFTPEAAATEP